MYYSLLVTTLLLGLADCQQPPGGYIDLNGLYYTPIFRKILNGPPDLFKPYPVPLNSMALNSHLECLHNNKSILNLDSASPAMLKDGINCKLNFTKQIELGDSSKTYLLTKGNFKIIEKPIKDGDSQFRGLKATTENPKTKDKKGGKGKGKKAGSTTPEPSKNDKKGKTTIKPKKTYKDGSKITTPKPVTDDDGNRITTTPKPGKKGKNLKSTTKIYKYKLGKGKVKTTKPPKGGIHTTPKAGQKGSTTAKPVIGGKMNDDEYRGLRQGGMDDWRSSIKNKWRKLSGVLESIRKKKRNSNPNFPPARPSNTTS